MNNLIKFIGQRYDECASVADPNLRYVDYQILSPVERLNHELASGMRKNIININADEAVLVNYNFSYFDRMFSIPLYIPYIYEDSQLIIGGIHYECLLSMIEKLFSVRTDVNGLTIKVIRSPFSCYHNTLHPFTDEISGEQFVGSIVSCKIYLKKISKTKKTKATVIHYLLCRYSLQEMLMMFDLDPDSIHFVEWEKEPDLDYYYFKMKKSSNKHEQIYLKVKKTDMLANRLLYDIVTTIVYITSGFRNINYDELINDSKTIFMILLGKIIYNNSLDRIHALSYMHKHLESVDTYLDNYTRDIYHLNDIKVNNIYELLVFVVKNISKIILGYPNNNMYKKRLEAINNIIIDNLIRSVNYKIYKYDRKPDFDHMFKMINKSLKVTPRFILKHLGKSDSVRFSPSIYGDNWLLSVGDKIVKRLSASIKGNVGSKGGGKSHGSGINAHVNRFHPSMLVVESAIGFSSKPGSNCLLNPYAIIDSSGGFVRDEFAEQTDIIQNYLSNEQRGLLDKRSLLEAIDVDDDDSDDVVSEADDLETGGQLPVDDIDNDDEEDPDNDDDAYIRELDEEDD
jgi:hypothetical protein